MAGISEANLQNLLYFYYIFGHFPVHAVSIRLRWAVAFNYFLMQLNSLFGRPWAIWLALFDGAVSSTWSGTVLLISIWQEIRVSEHHTSISNKQHVIVHSILYFYSWRKLIMHEHPIGFHKTFPSKLQSTACGSVNVCTSYLWAHISWGNKNLG